MHRIIKQASFSFVFVALMAGATESATNIPSRQLAPRPNGLDDIIPIPLVPPRGGAPRPPSPVDLMLEKTEEKHQAMRSIQSTFEEIPMHAAVRDAARKELQGITELKASRPQTPEFVQLEVDAQRRVGNADKAYRAAVVELVHNLLDFQLKDGAVVTIDGQTIQVRSIEKIAGGDVEISFQAADIAPLILPTDIVIRPGEAAHTMTVKFGNEASILVRQDIPLEAEPLGPH